MPRLVLTGCLSMLLAATAAAQDVYKYRDGQGRLVFSDRKPSSHAYEQQPLVVTEQQKKVAVVNRGTRERPILFAVNQLAGPVQVWLEFSRNENLRFTQAEPFVWLVDGPGEVLLLQIERDNAEQPWAYEWQAKFAVGRPVAKDALDKSPLAVPFAGGPFAVSQAFFGEQSHKQHINTQYAVDIPLPLNTPILAARDGIVMEAEGRFSRSGWDTAYADEANLVRLLHGDGSMTVYAHLNVNSIVVAPGQAVKAGQVLGYSGNTGYSSGPHLHFAWQVNTGQSVESLPFQFPVGVPVVGLLLQGAALP